MLTVSEAIKALQDEGLNVSRAWVHRCMRGDPTNGIKPKLREGSGSGPMLDFYIRGSRTGYLLAVTPEGFEKLRAEALLNPTRKRGRRAATKDWV